MGTSPLFDTRIHLSTSSDLIRCQHGLLDQVIVLHRPCLVWTSPCLARPSSFCQCSICAVASLISVRRRRLSHCTNVLLSPSNRYQLQVTPSFTSPFSSASDDVSHFPSRSVVLMALLLTLSCLRQSIPTPSSQRSMHVR